MLLHKVTPELNNNCHGEHYGYVYWYIICEMTKNRGMRNMVIGMAVTSYMTNFIGLGIMNIMVKTISS